MDPLDISMRIASSGISAQSTRLRVVSENLANALSTGGTPGADPFRRKTVAFNSEVDRVSGANLVHVASYGVDRTPFSMQHDPSNPGADANGDVKLSNVNTIMELADMREANRSYEADLQVMKQTRDLISMTIDLLKGTQ
jgi:flagellar basal-body rod protein FlgC